MFSIRTKEKVTEMMQSRASITAVVEVDEDAKKLKLIFRSKRVSIRSTKRKVRVKARCRTEDNGHVVTESRPILAFSTRKRTLTCEREEIELNFAFRSDADADLLIASIGDVINGVLDMDFDNVMDLADEVIDGVLDIDLADVRYLADGMDVEEGVQENRN